jgi:hypothetical protein
LEFFQGGLSVAIEPNKLKTSLPELAHDHHRIFMVRYESPRHDNTVLGPKGVIDKSIGVRSAPIHRRRILKIKMVEAELLCQRIPECCLSRPGDAG